MKKIISILAGLFFTIILSAHPWKPNHYVIIDTDGGIDDMRAITMLLASPDIRVLGIVVSSGVLNADSVYSKVRSLLCTFHHEGIPVAISRNDSFNSPDFALPLKLVWGKPAPASANGPWEGSELIREILKYERTKISFICMGGMSFVASLVSDETFNNGVKQIIWSVDGETRNEGFNYAIDRSAAEKVLKSRIPVKLIRGLDGITFYDDQFIKSVNNLAGVYPACISSAFNNRAVREHKFSYVATDEMIPLFLHYPGYFREEQENLFVPETDKLDQIYEGTLKILSGETVQKNQVIRHFPDDPSFYFEDVETNVSNIIKKYGKDEWVAGVLANELHRHLGTYAIIGVKMGIRAREYFNTGVDEFIAVSNAGSMPPLSCMNDGVQVSTGATPGHGLLTVKNDNPAPSVEFTYLNHKIRLTLKPEIASRISSELKEINFVYGLDSNIYWELVRKNTIRYWLELDRHEIFIIEEL